MANLKNTKITKSDLQEYLDDYSDFKFEMKALNCFSSEFKVEHGGTYEDPITNKFREFDIRATYTVKKPFKYNIYLAVEAKNLHKNFPLLISCIPRVEDEAYHQLVISKYDPDPNRNRARRYGKISHINHHYNKIYECGSIVGKSLDQIGRRAHDDDLHNDDSKIYSKWSQAVNSSYDLAQKAYFLSKKDVSHRVYISFVMPIVVVPDHTLWRVQFQNSGEQIDEPQKADECRYFIGNKLQLGDNLVRSEYSLSHLHFMTLSRFKEFVNNIKSYHESIFPQEAIHF